VTPTELAAVLTAIAALIGALGGAAWWQGKRGKSAPTRLLTLEEADRLHADTRGEIRQLHAEVRASNKEIRDGQTEIRDKIVRVEAKFDASR